MAESEISDGLNAEQQLAVAHGDSPLLIIAGAGTGKTQTLVHRVAHLIERGTHPGRVLLLTFTRRAAAEMLRRVDGLLSQMGNRPRAGTPARPSHKVWGGTFHAIATRLLRMHGQAVGLSPDFTILDRGDSEDLLNVMRTELGFHQLKTRFPRKGTCMAIYSYCVNTQRPLAKVLHEAFPWCEEYVDQLMKLFQAYVDRKDAAAVLDYDDLLLFWRGLMKDGEAAEAISNRFECVLVDEYQDTNHLQAETLQLLCPEGRGLTVVGDDCQSIYAFRGATVRNILEFPNQCNGATTVKLEQNYRSTVPILNVTNDVMAGATDQFSKSLWSSRDEGDRPHLVTCESEHEQTDEVIRQVLEHREAGISLRQQAVLFRASYHSIFLEAELARHNIPFVKYGGLKFIETAHVKDLLGFLRLAENPRDIVAGSRVLVLLPGIGPKTAQRLLEQLAESGGDFSDWRDTNVPTACENQWPKLVKLLSRISGATTAELPAQIHAIRDFYEPLLEKAYDNSEARLRDLEQLEQLATRFDSRQSFLSEIALDPPAQTEDLAGPPHLDEDYLILSTIHSAKGLEWDAVYVIHAADGNIPSDMSTKDPDQIAEERRLFYVALTRAKDWLYVFFPQRCYQPRRGQFSGAYNFAQLTRFIPTAAKDNFHCRTILDATMEQLAAKGDSARRRIRESSWS
jgi:DNA helicase-2/ATP-dependent DNA helicase PcrA